MRVRHAFVVAAVAVAVAVPALPASAYPIQVSSWGNNFTSNDASAEILYVHDGESGQNVAGDYGLRGSAKLRSVFNGGGKGSTVSRRVGLLYAHRITEIISLTPDVHGPWRYFHV